MNYREQVVRSAGHTHWFVVPEPGAHISGGHLYNAQLLKALRALSGSCQALTWEAALAQWSSTAGWYWFDSLYLERLASLSPPTVGVKLGLLLHYLPSLVARGDGLTASDLTVGERTALARAQAFIVPSAYMADKLARLGVTGRPLYVLEPAAHPTHLRPKPDAASGVRALFVSHLIEGKGVLPFLTALSTLLTEQDALSLRIVGGTNYEPDYAHACARVVRETPALTRAVSLLGQRSHTETLALLQSGNLFISTSRMESYGMALAEARSSGLPIIATDVGNTRAHVHESQGGRLFSSEAAVADECVKLARDAGEHQRRIELAGKAPHQLSDWAALANSFLRQAELRQAELGQGLWQGPA